MQQQRLPSLLDRPITFAHRGAKAHAPDNTIEAFKLGLEMGATGLESDVWVTADHVVVMDHDGIIRRGLFSRKPIRELKRAELPAHIPALTDLFDEVGTDFELSLDLKDHGCGPRVIETVREAAPELIPRLWLCEPNLSDLVSIREFDDEVRLVDSTRLHRIDEGPERRAALLKQERIDAINMRQPDWNGGLVTLFHRFGITAFMWDVQHEHHLRPAFRMGIDGVFSDHVDRMSAIWLEEVAPPPAT